MVEVSKHHFRVYKRVIETVCLDSLKHFPIFAVDNHAARG